MKKPPFNSYLVPFRDHIVCFYTNYLKDGGFTVNEVHYSLQGKYVGSAVTLVRQDGQREIISFLEQPTK
jgi:hypothetical protein